jgi:hypothetical protein
VVTVDLRGAIGFSSFGVLLYYLVANLAAYTQAAHQRRFPRWLQVLGAAGCLLLTTTLPWQAVVAGTAVCAAGAAYRATRLTIARTRWRLGQPDAVPLIPPPTCGAGSAGSRPQRARRLPLDPRGC